MLFYLEAQAMSGRTFAAVFVAALMVLAAPLAQATWVSQDVGSPVLPGSSTGTPPGPISVTGDGHDIWDNSDDFHYAFDDVPVSGNFTAIARLFSTTPGVHSWQKAGIMARADLTGGSVHVQTAGTQSNFIEEQWRDTATQGSGNQRVPGSPQNQSAQPYWLLLERTGNDFRSSWARDVGGTPGDWQASVTHTSPNMPADAYLGLSVTSHTDGATTTAVFDNVDLNAPAQPTSYPVSYRVDSDDTSYLYITDNDLDPEGQMLHEGQPGTQTGSFYMPEGPSRYAHFRVHEDTGGQWGAAQFTAPPGFVFRETGTQYVSTNHDLHTVDDDHQWLASHLEWGEVGYNAVGGVDHPWPPASDAYEPQDEGDAGAPYQPGTRRIWWKYTTDPNNAEAFFSTRLSLEPGAWSVIYTPEPSITEPEGLSTHILRVTDDLGDLNEARDALNAGRGWGNHYVSEVRSIGNANVDDSASNYGSPVGRFTPDQYTDGTPRPEDTAMRLSAYVYAPTDDYIRSFAVRSDDDAYLMLGDMEFIRAGGGPHVVPVRFPTQGYYPMELVYRNRGGDAGVEISSREGFWTTFDVNEFMILGTDPSYAVYERPGGLGSPEVGANDVGEPVYEGSITPVSDGLRVQQAFPGYGMGNVDQSISYFADKKIYNMDKKKYDIGYVETRKIMDMTDPEGSGAGNWGLNKPFPNDNMDPNNPNPGDPFDDQNFATRINGLIRIPEPGTYAFTVGTDDGFQLRVGNRVLGRFTAGRGIPGGRANYMYAYFDKAGLYPLEFYSHEGGGGSAIEIAHGGSTALLVADRNPANNGFTVDWDGVGYAVEPVAQLQAVGLELRGRAYGEVPALGIAVRPERWQLTEIVQGSGARIPGVRGDYWDTAGYPRNNLWDEGSWAYGGFRDDLTSGDAYFGDNFGYGPWGGSATYEEDFAAKWTGYLQIPETGTYHFRMNTDDDSWLFIDVDGDGVVDPAPGNAEWTVNWNNVDLTEGLHLIDFRGREHGGGEWSRLEWDPPWGGWDTIPASYFSQNIYDGTWAARLLAEGTGMIGDLLGDGLLMSFPMDFDTTHHLRLTMDIAGLAAVYEDDFLFVPEPGSLVLLAGGIFALATRRRRRR